MGRAGRENQCVQCPEEWGLPLGTGSMRKVVESMGGKTALLETAEKEVFCFVVVCLFFDWFFNGGSVFVNDLLETENVMLGSRTQIVFMGTSDIRPRQRREGHMGCSLPAVFVYSVTWMHPQLRLRMLPQHGWTWRVLYQVK